MGDGGVVFLHTGGAALLFVYEGQLLICIVVE